MTPLKRGVTRFSGAPRRSERRDSILPLTSAELSSSLLLTKVTGAHLKRRYLDYVIFVSTLLLLMLVVGTILWNVSTQVSNYQQVLRQEIDSQMPSKVFLLSANRALDFVLIRSAALLFGVVLTLLGGLYLFKLFETPFELAASGSREISIALKTSSPGMVMITLGVVLIIATVYARNSVNYRIETSGGVTRESASSLKNDPQMVKSGSEASAPEEPRVVDSGSPSLK